MKKSAIVYVLTLAAALRVAPVAAQSSTTPTKHSNAPAAGTSSVAKPRSKSTAKASSAAKTGASTKLTLTTQKDKASYAIGLNIGKSMRRQSVEVDPGVVAQGLKDGFSDSKPLLTDDEVRATLTAFQTEMNAKQEARRKQAGEQGLKEGDAFLAGNKTKPDVVTLPSGLQYKVVTAGTGPKPAASDTVVCNYRGTLINGTEFDSSSKHGGPAKFPVGRVIPGWTEALQLMPVGSKWQLYIPSKLAYGEQGAGDDIPPNSTLIFDIELISIEAKK